MAEKVWISQEDALEAVRSSEWAKLKEPHIIEHFSFSNLTASIASMTSKQTISGLSERQKLQRKFKLFIQATLTSFHSRNPSAVRAAENENRETELGSLNRFLDAALAKEIEGEFGIVPSFEVD